MTWRWSPCVWSRGEHAAALLVEVVKEPQRRVLYVGGAGFDPRTLCVFSLLHPILGDRLSVFLFRENRPRPDADLVRRAEEQLKVFEQSGVACKVVDLAIFAVDNAPVGGREAARSLAEANLGEYTDIVVDFSALSLGVSFPVARLLLEIADRTGTNLHAVAVHAPELDRTITGTAIDRATPVHGFVGEWGLDASDGAVKLWVPQLLERSREILTRIYQVVTPHDVCPVLPFPSSDPRRGDRLLGEYWSEIEQVWEIGPQNLIYAGENDPVDLYRSILRIDDVRRAVFAKLGGSLTILSPLGTKVTAIGGFMAAVERNLPVLYVESHAYSLPRDTPDRFAGEVEIVHVWLAGEAYGEEGELSESPEAEGDDVAALPVAAQGVGAATTDGVQSEKEGST